METQQLSSDMKDFFGSEVFKDFENKVVKEAVSAANETARKELNLFKFEMLYPNIVSEKEREEVEREVIEFRDEKWKKALEEAGGDEQKALELI